KSAKPRLSSPSISCEDAPKQASPSAITGSARRSVRRRTAWRSASFSSSQGAISRAKKLSKPLPGSAVMGSRHQLVDVDGLARGRVFHFVEGKGLHIGKARDDGARENLDRIVEPRHRRIVEAARGGDVALHFLERRL